MSKSSAKLFVHYRSTWLAKIWRTWTAWETRLTPKWLSVWSGSRTKQRGQKSIALRSLRTTKILISLVVLMSFTTLDRLLSCSLSCMTLMQPKRQRLAQSKSVSQNWSARPSTTDSHSLSKVRWRMLAPWLLWWPKMQLPNSKLLSHWKLLAFLVKLHFWAWILQLPTWWKFTRAPAATMRRSTSLSGSLTISTTNST